MKGVYDCKIISQTEVAPGVVRTILIGPEIARESKPGQFVNVRVSDSTDPLLRRPFSVHAASPSDGTYSLLYVLVGRGTALLRKMQPGTKISVVGPLGSSFDLGNSLEAEHIVVAGGCGAAPLHFLCDALCEKWGCERVTVLSGAQSRNALLCEGEFRAHGVDVGISTDDGSYGYKGFVTQLLEERLSGSITDHKSQITNDRVRVYSCGPHAMLREVARISLAARVQSCQVSLENAMACGLGVCTGCVQKIRDRAIDLSHDDALHRPHDAKGWHYERVCTEGPVFNAEDVVWE